MEQGEKGNWCFLFTSFLTQQPGAKRLWTGVGFCCTQGGYAVCFCGCSACQTPFFPYFNSLFNPPPFCHQFSNSKLLLSYTTFKSPLPYITHPQFCFQTINEGYGRLKVDIKMRVRQRECPPYIHIVDSLCTCNHSVCNHLSSSLRPAAPD